jgi:hypothetical protein
MLQISATCSPSDMLVCIEFLPEFQAQRWLFVTLTAGLSAINTRPIHSRRLTEVALLFSCEEGRRLKGSGCLALDSLVYALAK